MKMIMMMRMKKISRESKQLADLSRQLKRPSKQLILSKHPPLSRKRARSDSAWALRALGLLPGELSIEVTA
jgi:hypothetical protein